MDTDVRIKYIVNSAALSLMPTTNAAIIIHFCPQPVVTKHWISRIYVQWWGL